jgi:hypothetical protein
MADKSINNYRLRRTLPKLSGNMQLDLIIHPVTSGRNTGALMVRQAHLRPIGSDTYVPVVDERLMDRTHQLNIKDFYERTRSSFYTHPYDSTLNSDWPRMVSWSEMDRMKYIKRWDDTCWAGAKRSRNKLYGCTHEIFVPLWLEQCDGLRFNIEICAAESDATAASFTLDLSPVYLQASWTTRTAPPFPGAAPGKLLLKNFVASETFNNDFVQYFIDYLDYIGVADGTPDVMAVDFQNNVTTLAGLQVESGNVTVRQNFNIARNLLFRERPLLEANSLLTNSFMDNKMIVKQLINFNLCFDLDELLGLIANADSFTAANQYKVRVSVQALRKYRDTHLDSMIEPHWDMIESVTENQDSRDCGYIWEDLEVRDFYTNHYYIPRPKAQFEYQDGVDNTYEVEDSPLNALAYKRDYQCTDIMHANKISQPICHWVNATNPDGDLFNVYDGFGAYAVDSDGNFIEYDHGFGQTPDLSDSEYDESTDNTAWLGVKLKGTGATIENILNAPLSKVESGFFSDASNFINGLQFNYSAAGISYDNTADRSAPSKVYIGVMTTPADCNLTALWNKSSTQVNEISIINILTDRRDERTDVPTWGTLPQYQKEEGVAEPAKRYAAKDIMYDWHLYSDGDNRFSVTYSGKDISITSDYRIYYDPTGTILKEGYYAWLKAFENGNLVNISKVIAKTEIPDSERLIATDITRSMLVRLGGSAGPNYTASRDDENMNSLYVAFRRYPADGINPTASDPLYVIFFQPEAEAHTTTSGQVMQNLRPHALTPGRLIEALQSYWNKYKPAYDALLAESEGGDVDIPTGSLPDMSDLNVIVQTMSTISVPEVIYFDRTIRPVQDITLSSRAHEVNYMKDTGANAYVWRYSASIKPAIEAHTASRANNKLYFDTKPNAWGRNFIWGKDPIFPVGQKFPSELTPYISKGIAPEYPSLGFEVVRTTEFDIENQRNPQGDLMYDEVPPLYKGLTDDGVSLDDYTVKDFILPSQFGQYKSLSLSMIEGIDSDFTDTSTDESQWSLFDSTMRSMILAGQYDANAVASQPKEIVYWLYKPDYDTYKWAEYKWFDQSIITTLPKRLIYRVQSDTNTKSDLENIVLKMMSGAEDRADYIAGTDSGILNQTSIKYDFAYLRSCYDFQYNLIKIEPVMNTGKFAKDSVSEQVLYKYIYEIIAELK